MAQSLHELPDEALVRLVLAGDKEAYGELVRRYQNLAYRLAAGLLKDCDRAEDAAQEAFCRGYRHLERLRNPSAFASWLAAIVRNACRNVQRAERNAPLSLDDLAEIGIEPDDCGNAGSFDPELIEAIRSGLERLSDQDREILELHHFEEMTCSKMAVFLGISRTAANSRLLRARKRLEDTLRKGGWL
jgi:RNA polymerase sigma factor (sigma-70 family)